MNTRRKTLLNLGLGASLLTGLRGVLAAAPAASKIPPVREVKYTEAEWRKLLTGQQYAVLREGGTETPYSSPLNKEHRPGQFNCAGCNQALFSSKVKFESGTGWPSFWQPLTGAVDQDVDSTLGMERTEVLCHRCGGHLGHVFEDGPKPTGLRYCMNGVALKFNPGAA